MITINGPYTEGGGSYEFVGIVTYKNRCYYNNKGDRVFVKDGDVLRPVDNCKAFALYKRV